MRRTIIAHHGYEIDGQNVDHINDDRLDNKLENLQLVTKADNRSLEMPSNHAGARVLSASYRQRYSSYIRYSSSIP